jgi:hypothetical protein
MLDAVVHRASSYDDLGNNESLRHNVDCEGFGPYSWVSELSQGRDVHASFITPGGSDCRTEPRACSDSPGDRSHSG